MLLRALAFFALAALAHANPLKAARDEHSGNSGTEAKDYLVTTLPGLHEMDANDIPLMFAGQLELFKENNTHYFFWKFVDQNKAPEAINKTIFWLNGGPGCSSMDGALMEAGPLRVNEDKKVVYNKGSWHRKGDIVFVDQPAGTGFSYTDELDHELDQIKWEFLRFMDKYFDLFPEDANNEIVFAGESYAGQYIPYIASAVLWRNKQKGARKYNVTGLLIGNGWISPNEQSLLYLPFAVQAGMIDLSHPHWSALLNQHEQCQKKVAEARAADSFAALEVESSVCDAVLNKLLTYTRDSGASKHQQCFNMYDYTLKDLFPSCGMNWPPDLADVTPFLRQENVMSDLNLIKQMPWHECGGQVGHAFKAKKSKPSIKLFPGLLAEIPIVLFHGNRDIICNYIGGEDMIKHLTWGGQQGFSDNVLVYDWQHEGSSSGYVKSERNLTFVNVYDASHMVPFDKPEVSRALMDILYARYTVEEEKTVTTYEVGKFPLLGAQDSTVNSTVTSGANSTESATTPLDNHTPSRAVRLIQLAVIIVVIWGICALYSTYRSKPISIIKTKPGRKKNVQWADQVEDEEEDRLGLFTKALNKLKRSDGRGEYAPTANYEDIEMAEDLEGAKEDTPDGQAEDTTPAPEDFLIGSDEETV